MTKKERKIPEPKPLFVERMTKLLSDKTDNENYWKISKIEPANAIRCNTLKISPTELIKKLKNYNWIINQPWKEYPEVMIILGKSLEGKKEEIINERGYAKLFPGELGRTIEHLLGYYYIQELSSMLPIIALEPKKNELILDLCAAPGSKTTQMAAKMNNTGTIIANEMNLGRLRILASNLERCGVTNTIITRHEGRNFCNNMKNGEIKFDKILVDAPCSGEGTLRSSPKTFLMWNPKIIKSLSHLQKQLFLKAFERLKINGEMVYSTCTHAPEENEEVIDYCLNELKDKIEILDIKLPVKTREGVTKWEDKKYSEKVKLAKRIYPQDNDTEGFFISKFRKIKE